MKKSFDMTLHVYRLDNLNKTLDNVSYNTGKKVKGMKFDKQTLDSKSNSALRIRNFQEDELLEQQANILSGVVGFEPDGWRRGSVLSTSKPGVLNQKEKEAHVLSDYAQKHVCETAGGFSFSNLLESPKGKAIGKTYLLNRDTGEYTSRSFQERAFFTRQDKREVETGRADMVLADLDRTNIEMVVVNGEAVFNTDMRKQVGRPLVGNAVTAARLAGNDNLGSGNGLDEQVFRLASTPVDVNEPMELVTENGGVLTVWSQVTTFTIGGTNEYKLEPYSGLIIFNTAADGGVPSTSDTLYASYTSTAAVEYEPEWTGERIYWNTNLSNASSRKDQGFVNIKSILKEVASVTLSSNIATALLGNAPASLTATALDKQGNPVADVPLTFEVVKGPASFGGMSTQGAITDGSGSSIGLLGFGSSVEDIGYYVASGVVGGGQTVFTVPGATFSSSRNVILYRVEKHDAAFQPGDNLETYYEDYIAAEGITAPIMDWSSNMFDNGYLVGSLDDAAKWEYYYRHIHGLEPAGFYNPLDTEKGIKKIAATFNNPDGIDPATGNKPYITPVVPATVTTTPTESVVTYNHVINTTPTTNSFFIAGESSIEVRAIAINPATGGQVVSPVITIPITASREQSGLVYVDAVGDIIDETLGFPLTNTGLLPLGWRLPSTNTSLASALNALTFINL